jgi:hypothetical protein
MYKPPCINYLETSQKGKYPQPSQKEKEEKERQIFIQLHYPNTPLLL